MTISIKHSKVSAKGDGGDATLIRPTDWNAEHTTSMATNRLIGRVSLGAGAFEEIPISALLADALAAATGPEFLAALGVGGFRTGDIKYGFDPSPETGWIVITSNSFTIGKLSSGATYAAADAEALYTALWNNTTNTEAPVSSGRGANAAADFAASKIMTLPALVGRAPHGAGTGGSGISTRVNGVVFGAETHTLTTSEMPSHYHSVGIFDPSHAHAVTTSNSSTSTPGGAFACGAQPVGASTGAASTGVRGNSSNGLDTTYSTGSGGSHTNLSPGVAIWAKVKL